jgi:ATP-dependent DNA helicase RecG
MRENEAPVQYLKGVGPKRSKLFGLLDIEYVSDVLYYYPKDWQNRAPNQDTYINPKVFLAEVLSTDFINTRSRLSIFKAEMITDKKQKIHAEWFKMASRYAHDPFKTLKENLKPGKKVYIVGRTENLLFEPEPKVRVEEVYFADDKKALALHVNRLVPTYNLTQGISSKLFREIVANGIEKYAHTETECVPLSLINKRQLISIHTAIKQIHFPDSPDELDKAKLRMIYEEFLFLTTAWEIKKRQTKGINKPHSYKVTRKLLTPFRENLGFEFTAAQKRVITEIFNDMSGRKPMTRLLQGDVGSGKTVVALSALLLAVENKHQGAFMAPTEILAEQHFMTFKRFLSDLPVNFEILTSKTTKKQKTEILEKIKKGELDILIGTHALIEDNVIFKNLKTVVIDEQHRFGGKQRAVLRQKSKNTDLLIMTATPIPRTLALAYFGDLDVSTIDSLPPGRQPVETREVTQQAAFEIAKQEVSKGRQVYIVHPLIEESKILELKSVKEEYEKLSKNVFPDLNVEMIHGQMTGKQKTKTMERFLKGEINILLATPVIEVGIDVKNATVMIIQSPQRFGLASLHQLRGRIGRGEHKSICMLVTDGNSTERTKALCQLHDGFRIGEKDMEIRGPGEILGTRQHGEEIETKIGHFTKDKEIMDWAIEDRNDILKNDENLIKPENRNFRKKLQNLYGRRWHLIDLS